MQTEKGRQAGTPLPFSIYIYMVFHLHMLPLSCPKNKLRLAVIGGIGEEISNNPVLIDVTVRLPHYYHYKLPVTRGRIKNCSQFSPQIGGWGSNLN